jgi:pimeloyl-ACP methyl ester carboxylesterase
MQTPPVRTLSLGAAEFTKELQDTGATGGLLLQLATGSSSGTLPCGVDVNYITYGTVGGKGEAATASGALMVPSGPGCTGPHPIVLFAHGTSVERSFNLADVPHSTNDAYNTSILLMSQLVANGFIVVAPNYAGYDSSSLSYHPFLIADQQSKDMIDALRAARKALPTLLSTASDNGKLYVTGYSQGGYVAMATAKAMEAATAAGATDLKVNASSPLSPVSALSAYVDYIMLGHIPVASTYLMPMAITGYQKTYGDVYATPSDYYESNYATGIEASFPGSFTSTTLVSSLKVPQLHLFSSGAATDGDPTSNYLWSLGVGAVPLNLIKDTARAGYATSAFKTRIQANDLSTYSPTTSLAPMMYCGGSNDPTVFFGANTIISANNARLSPLVAILDLENAYTGYTGFGKVIDTAPSTTIAQLQGGFQSAKAAAGDATAQAAAYHGTLVPPFCIAAARGFFAKY